MAADPFQDAVEKALMRELKNMEERKPGERDRLLKVCVGWVGIKGRILTGDHGSGFLDDEPDDPVDDEPEP